MLAFSLEFVPTEEVSFTASDFLVLSIEEPSGLIITVFHLQWLATENKESGTLKKEKWVTLNYTIQLISNNILFMIAMVPKPFGDNNILLRKEVS